MNIFILILTSIASLQLQTLQVYATPALCADGVTEGYADWTTLQNAFGNLVLPSDTTFTLCPNSVIQNDDNYMWGLEILAGGNLVLQCGYDGSRANNCVIASVEEGRHITMGGDYNFDHITRNITVKGIKFIHATGVPSILINSMLGIGTYSFIDCSWEVSLCGCLYLAHWMQYEKSVLIRTFVCIQDNLGGYAVSFVPGEQSSLTFKDCDFIVSYELVYDNVTDFRVSSSLTISAIVVIRNIFYRPAITPFIFIRNLVHPLHLKIVFSL